MKIKLYSFMLFCRFFSQILLKNLVVCKKEIKMLFQKPEKENRFFFILPKHVYGIYQLCSDLVLLKYVASSILQTHQTLLNFCMLQCESFVVNIAINTTDHRKIVISLNLCGSVLTLKFAANSTNSR